MHNVHNVCTIWCCFITHLLIVFVRNYVSLHVRIEDLAVNIDTENNMDGVSCQNGEKKCHGYYGRRYLNGQIGSWLAMYIISYKICTQFCYVSLNCGWILSSWWILMRYLPILFRVTSLALGQSLDCPSANEVTLRNMGKMDLYQMSTNSKVWTICIFLGM